MGQLSNVGHNLTETFANPALKKKFYQKMILEFL